MDIKNKILLLDNNDKYVVLDSITYQNVNYLLVAKTEDEENLDSDLAFAELVDNKMNFIKDPVFIEQLKELFNVK